MALCAELRESKDPIKLLTNIKKIAKLRQQLRDNLRTRNKEKELNRDQPNQMDVI